MSLPSSKLSPRSRRYTLNELLLLHWFSLHQHCLSSIVAYTLIFCVRPSFQVFLRSYSFSSVTVFCLPSWSFSLVLLLRVTTFCSVNSKFLSYHFSPCVSVVQLNSSASFFNMIVPSSDDCSRNLTCSLLVL